MTISHLTSGRLLARNAIWNFAGLVVPLLAGLLTIPLLIEGLGKERFGLLAIIWMGVGYFSLFDIGLGRALTKLVAERLARKQPQEEIAELIWTALQLIVGLSGVAALLLLIFSGKAAAAFNVPQALIGETVVSFRILAVGIPFVVLTSALTGILVAYQRFATITIVRAPLGMLTFLGPLASLQISSSLIWATAALLAARLCALIAYGWAVARVSPAVARPHWLIPRHVRPLFAFGGWLTVTNVVGPIMVSFDRFLIGTLLTMTAVTYYVTPFEVLSRLQMLPHAFMAVMFPALTMAFASDRGRLVELFRQGRRILFFLMLPALGLFFLFGADGLCWWVGQEISQAAAPVVHWLAAGWMINVMARMPSTTLQGAGRPDLTAKIHLAELLPYTLVLYVFTRQFGIAGTAAAWFLRALADTVILNLMVRRCIPELAKEVDRTLVWLCLVAAGFGVARMIDSAYARAVVLALVCLTSGICLVPTIKKVRPGLLLGFKRGDQ
jgi:O-antigen/teichoic acid export membrane protein